MGIDPPGIVRRIKGIKSTVLLQIIGAGNAFRSLSRLVESWQQHCRKDSDDRNYDQEFYQRKILSHRYFLSISDSLFGQDAFVCNPDDPVSINNYIWR